MDLQLPIRLSLVVLLAGAVPAAAQSTGWLSWEEHGAGVASIEFESISEKSLAGFLPDAGLQFSVGPREEWIVASVQLHSGTEILAEVDYLKHNVIVKSVSRQTGAPEALLREDLVALRRLRESLDPGLVPVLSETLARALDFVSSYPPDAVVDFASVRSDIEPVATKRVTSICNLAGKKSSGTYNVEGRTYREKVQIGPCYSQPTECMGRCGPGCDTPPDRTIQRFTQDCLNHDLCTRRTGDILGECSDEWTAAGDDFFFGTDCGALNGTWVDNFSYRYRLSQGSVGIITGNVDGAGTESHCETWAVTGTHNGTNISLTARRLFQPRGCCTSFTFTGKANGCNKAGGTWTNACNRSGTWTLTRRNNKELFEMFSEGSEGSSPGGSDE